MFHKYIILLGAESLSRDFSSGFLIGELLQRYGLQVTKYHFYEVELNPGGIKSMYVCISVCPL